MRLLNTLAQLPLMAWFVRQRFLKFGTVGASGVLINLSAFYLAQEYFFAAIQSPKIRLNIALAFAIFCATLSNFCWNRRWTWADCSYPQNKPIIVQFCQYALGSWLGIVLQIMLTQCFIVLRWHYLIANLAAILFASTFNFLLHHFWTFKTSSRTAVGIQRGTRKRT